MGAAVHRGYGPGLQQHGTDSEGLGQGPSLYGSSEEYQDQARDAQEELGRASDDQSKWSCSVTFALHCSQVGRATLFIVLRL